MAYKIIVKEEAVQDTLKGYQYYEQQDKLGETYLKELNTRYKQLEHNPQQNGLISPGAEKTLRSVKVKDFKSYIVYEFMGKDVIVYAVQNFYEEQ